MFVDGPSRDAVTIETSGTHTAVRGWLEPGVSAIQTDAPELLGPCLQALDAEHGWQHTVE